MSSEQEDIGKSLLEAAKEGDTNRVEELLKDDAAAKYVNYKTQNLLSPLLIASCFGRKDVVEILLNKGAKVDMMGLDGMTALSAASESGHQETVRILAKAGARIDHISHHSLFTPLMLASRHGHADTVQVLLELKANVNLTTDYSDYTPLMFASKGGHTEVVKLLLPHLSKVDVGSDRNGLTPLMLASANGHADVAQLLLDENESQVNRRCSNGYTSLLLASYFGHHEVAEVLIKHGADVDMRTKNGTSALIEACINKHTQFVKVLLDHNAEVNLSRYNEQHTALMIACKNNNLEIVKLLLRVENEQVSAIADVEMSGDSNEKEAVVLERSPKANVNLKDYSGRTALSLACENGDLEIVQMLVEHGADVNPSSKACMSPLLNATRRGHTDIVQVLLEKGANPNTSEDNRDDYCNIPPLIVATLCEHVDIVQLLLLHKGNVNVDVTLDGEIRVTPLMLAILAGCHKLVEIFVENEADVLNRFKCSDNLTLTDLANVCADNKIIRLLQSVSNTIEKDTSIENETTNDEIEPQAKRRRFNLVEDNSEESCKRLLMFIEHKYKSLDCHCPQRWECRITDLFPSDNYTSLLERLCHSSKGFTSPTEPSRNDKPLPLLTLKEAYKVLRPVMTEWMKIGALLNVEQGKLRQIKADGKDSDECLLLMLIEWLDGVVDPEPSWNILEESVREIKKAVAREIRDKFCP